MSNSIFNSHEFHEELRLGLDEAYVKLWREGFKVLMGYYITHGLINEAEDLRSETFLKLYRTRCVSFDPAKGSFEGWVFTVGKNTAIDLLRKRKEEDETTIPIDDCQHPTLPDSDEKETGGLRYLKVLVKRAEALLGPDDRTVLLLRLVQGWSYDWISEELGISVPTVTKRVSRALDRLWTEMERLSTRELQRRVRRPSRRNTGRTVSTSHQDQTKSLGAR